MTALLHAIRKKLAAADILSKSRPGRSDFTSFEERGGLTLPLLFHEYVSELNGMGDGKCDDLLISFYPLSRITIQDLDMGWSLTIGDYCIGTHIFCLRIQKEGRERGVVASDATHEKVLASTFEEFLMLYISKPFALTQISEHNGGSSPKRVGEF